VSRPDKKTEIGVSSLLRPWSLEEKSPRTEPRREIRSYRGRRDNDEATIFEFFVGSRFEIVRRGSVGTESSPIPFDLSGRDRDIRRRRRCLDKSVPTRCVVVGTRLINLLSGVRRYKIVADNLMIVGND